MPLLIHFRLHKVVVELFIASIPDPLELIAKGASRSLQGTHPILLYHSQNGPSRHHPTWPAAASDFVTRILR